VEIFEYYIVSMTKDFSQSVAHCFLARQDRIRLPIKQHN